jgi:hypothetical protein
VRSPRTGMKGVGSTRWAAATMARSLTSVVDAPAPRAHTRSPLIPEEPFGNRLADTRMNRTTPVRLSAGARILSPWWCDHTPRPSTSRARSTCGADRRITRGSRISSSTRPGAAELNYMRVIMSHCG